MATTPLAPSVLAQGSYQGVLPVITDFNAFFEMYSVNKAN